MTNEKIFACPKCGRIPSVIRSKDPAEIDKRYSIRCASNICRVNKVTYGATKIMAINNWNNFVAKVICPKTSTEDFVRS